jgi:hypothetical protein
MPEQVMQLLTDEFEPEVPKGAHVVIDPDRAPVADDLVLCEMRFSDGSVRGPFLIRFEANGKSVLNAPFMLPFKRVIILGPALCVGRTIRNDGDEMNLSAEAIGYHRVARLVVSLTGFARAGVHLCHVVRSLRIMSARALRSSSGSSMKRRLLPSQLHRLQSIQWVHM